MSRGLIVVCLLALAAAPLVRQAESAEDLTASLAEQGGSDAIDPVDPNDRDAVPVLSTAPRLVLDQDSPPLVPLAPAPFDARSLRVDPRPSRPAVPPPLPALTRERRLSRLRVLLI